MASFNTNPKSNEDEINDSKSCNDSIDIDNERDALPLQQQQQYNQPLRRRQHHEYHKQSDQFTLHPQHLESGVPSSSSSPKRKRRGKNKRKSFIFFSHIQYYASYLYAQIKSFVMNLLHSLQSAYTKTGNWIRDDGGSKGGNQGQKRTSSLLLHHLPFRLSSFLHNLHYHHPRLKFLIFLLLFILSYLLLCHPSSPINSLLFSPYSHRGGILGVLMDYQIKQYLYRQRIQHEFSLLNSLGNSLRYDIPKKVGNIPHSFQRYVVQNAIKEIEVKQEIMDFINLIFSSMTESNNDDISSSSSLLLWEHYLDFYKAQKCLSLNMKDERDQNIFSSATKTKVLPSIPHAFIQTVSNPLSSSTTNINGNSNRKIRTISIDPEDIRPPHFSSSSSLTFSSKSIENFALLCALFYNGGVVHFGDSNLLQEEQIVTEIETWKSTRMLKIVDEVLNYHSLHKQQQEQQQQRDAEEAKMKQSKKCDNMAPTPKIYIILTNNENRESDQVMEQRKENDEINKNKMDYNLTIIASPRHPLLLCAIQQFIHSSGKNEKKKRKTEEESLEKTDALEYFLLSIGSSISIENVATTVFRNEPKQDELSSSWTTLEYPTYHNEERVSSPKLKDDKAWDTIESKYCNKMTAMKQIQNLSNSDSNSFIKETKKEQKGHVYITKLIKDMDQNSNTTNRQMLSSSSAKNAHTDTTRVFIRPSYQVKEIVLLNSTTPNGEPASSAADSRIHAKISLHQMMASQSCVPNWLCGRCLRFPSSSMPSSIWLSKFRGGSFQNCRWICQDCFVNSICGLDGDAQYFERGNLIRGGSRQNEQQQMGKSKTGITENEKKLVKIQIKMIPNYVSSTDSALITSTMANDRSIYEKNEGTQIQQPKGSFPIQRKMQNSKLTSPSLLQSNSTPLIPRIIHQTWFEALSPAYRYPDLIRMQNSWRFFSSKNNWEYRFYTDKDVREYIATHYPTVMLEAYDALLPGAFKADIFRYLVLLKDGGLYADIDVMLNVNLDVFIDPNMSFFVPRDSVGEYAGGNFCLWNGLIGSAPGHPFLVRAVERSLNLVTNRADMFDMEQDICLESGPTMESWKVRAEPGLLLSGPCALGVSVNEALGRYALSNFEVGCMNDSSTARFSNSINPERGGQDDLIGSYFMILMQDKWDLGAMRFMDPEQQIIVATTDLPRLSKDPNTNVTGTERQIRAQSDTRPHYSVASNGQMVWGSKYVYRDPLVRDERFVFDTSYGT